MAMRLLPWVLEAAAGKLHGLPLVSARCAAAVPLQRLNDYGSPGTAWSWRSFSTSPNNSEGVERMLDLIAGSPKLQEMMMAALPKNMQRPEVLQGILENPAVKKKVAEMVAKQGMALPAGMLNMMDEEHLSQTMEQSKSLGLDPSTMFQKLLAQPGLMQKFRDPHIVNAFLEIAQDQGKLAKYQNDKEVIEVYFAAKEILLPSTAPSASSTSSAALDFSAVEKPAVTVLPPESSSGTPTQTFTPIRDSAPQFAASRSSAPASDDTAGPVSASVHQDATASREGQLQDSGLQQLMSDPERLSRLVKAGTNPRVQKALTDISNSKWKVLLYMFDTEVMAALKDLGDVAAESTKRH